MAPVKVQMACIDYLEIGLQDIKKMDKHFYLDLWLKKIVCQLILKSVQ